MDEVLLVGCCELRVGEGAEFYNIETAFSKDLLVLNLLQIARIGNCVHSN